MGNSLRSTEIAACQRCASSRPATAWRRIVVQDLLNARRVVLGHAHDKRFDQALAQSVDFSRAQALGLGQNRCGHGLHKPRVPCVRIERPGLRRRCIQNIGQHSAAATSAGFTDHQTRSNLDPLIGLAPPFQLLEKHFHCAIAHLEQRNLHAGQGRFLHGTFQPVVEADNGDVVRDTAPGLFERLDRAQGRFVVTGQDGSEGHTGTQDLLQRRISR